MSGDDLYIGPTALAPGPRQPNRHAQRLAELIVLPLVALLILVLLVFYVFFTTAQVDGPSMLPTLHDHDRVLVTHGLRTLQRGDIVVFYVNEHGQRDELVKRVVALPGDTVEIRNDAAYVNGVTEPARGQVRSARYSLSEPALRVPPGQLYVLGDNRPVSEDSRYIGTVAISGVKGKVVAIFSPLARIGRVR